MAKKTPSKIKKVGILGKPVVKRKSEAAPKKPQRTKESSSKKKRAISAHSEVETEGKCPGWSLASPLHRQCALIVRRLRNAQASAGRGATVKGLCLAPHVENKAAVYAVVCETLRFGPVLTELLTASRLLSNHKQLTEDAAHVLLYDLLAGQGVKPRGPAERAVLAAESELRDALQAMLSAAGVAAMSDLLPSSARRDAQPAWRRSARVNTLKMSVSDALRVLRAPVAGWPEKHTRALTPELDPHLPDVVHLPPGTDLHDHPLVLEGKLILQGKASCMPAHALQPAPGWRVVDCCAAPGNKTTHAAALVGRGGAVIAFERDPKRAELLRKTVRRAGAEHVTVCCGDFLEVDTSAEEYADVRGVVLDPSCSGSGTATTRLEHLLPGSSAQADEEAPEAVTQPGPTDSGNAGGSGGDQNADRSTPQSRRGRGQIGAGTGPSACGSGRQEFPGAVSSDTARVRALAEFQAKALSHALTFPKLERLVYSTCSVFREENEDVVAEVLPFAESRGFRLARALPQWPRRGLSGLYAWTDDVVRVHPQLDEADGFFVALFQRNASL